MPCRRSPHGQHAEIPVTVNMISPTLVFVAALHKWINGELFGWARCWAWRVPHFKVYRLDRWCQIIKHVTPGSRRNLVNNTIKRERKKKKKTPFKKSRDLLSVGLFWWGCLCQKLCQCDIQYDVAVVWRCREVASSVPPAEITAGPL